MNRYGLVVLTVTALAAATIGIDTALPQDEPSAASVSTVEALVDARAQQTLASGRKIFRFDTFGDEAFWGDTLRLHEAIAGRRNGGVGPGLSPEQALAVGLKVDVNALPPQLQTNLRNGRVDLTSPATTLVLLKLDAVVGVRGFFDDGGERLRSVGITCALCHSDVDDSFAPGIGRRLDGWAARDLDVGQIIALAPNLRPLVDLLAIVHPGIDAGDVRDVVRSWGPGKFDAELLLDGKAMRPDGKAAATLIPPAFGLAGVNLHTWTGWGSVTHWNAFVANLEMQGQGTFYDPRLNDAVKFPIAAAAGFGDVRNSPDLISPKLAPLHVYQLSLPAPRPRQGSFGFAAAQRGKALFAGRAQCARCHVPPLFTEPGWNMHTPEEIGIDSFQADRSPDERYRTAPLKGLWTHTKGGFYHDGRFPTLRAVLDHYDAHFSLGLSAQEKADLAEYLKSI
jgi:mono/diheme cytochrome c family protein